MLRRLCPALLLLLALIPNHGGRSIAQDEPAPQESADALEIIEIREGLVLPRVGGGGRSPVHVDPLEATLIDGTFTAPKAGDECKTWEGNTVQWKDLKPDEKGWFDSPDLRGGYLYASVESDSERVMILHARGHSIAYVNGEPRGGDVYNYGYAPHPVRLKQGVNEFLFLVARGRIKASLEPCRPVHPHFHKADLTVPDVVAGEPGREYIGQIPVINPTDEYRKVQLEWKRADGVYVSGRLHALPPMTTRKLPFTIEVKDAPKVGKLDVVLTLVSESEEEGGIIMCQQYDFHRFELEVVDPTRPRKVTFRSSIDGSIQYYGLRPAAPLAGSEDTPGIVLSLHGASVEAIGQARAYSPKSWCHIVCPTNRRPFGFDWEDWGRLDAMEVLEHAQGTLENDPTKVWLTGHSMGGHGTWTVGSHFPDQFAALGPSAGWESFSSYAGGGGHPEEYSISELLTRTSNPSRTLLRKYNYKQQGIYIVHGDADDNVPVSEGRNMLKELSEFHTDIRMHEQPGAGHWWDAGHDEGADCVDWQPMFDMFARRRLPRPNEIQYIDFTTVCPEHNSKCHWLWIQSQEQHLAPSRVQLRAEPNKRHFEGTTENISRFGIVLGQILPRSETVSLNIDGQEINEIPWDEHDEFLFLTKVDGQWKYDDVHWGRDPKGPHRYGWFKNAFRHNFVYVYGTQGSGPDSRANYNKARYDLETWSYRANGSFEIVPDSEFEPQDYAGRNVILVGNADTNSAWDKLLQDCPVRLENGKAVIGEETVEGDDLAMMFIYPRKDSEYASVGVIGGTGARGIQLTNRVRTFVSGASFPDFILYGPEMLHEGTGGVRCAGYFNEEWRLEGGEIVWNETADEE